MLLQSLASLGTPWLAGHVAAGLMGERTELGFGSGKILSLWLGLFVLQALVCFLSTYLLTRAGARILAQLSGLLYDHLQALPLAYFHQRKRGDVLALLSNDVAVISHFVTGTLIGVRPTLFVLFGAYALMATINTQVALLVAALIRLFFSIGHTGYRATRTGQVLLPTVGRKTSQALFSSVKLPQETTCAQ